ncbi:Adenylosuccinate lyase [Buchnera aphidicola (Eriosoma grossulariae)]|uniref:adenylosuccinate lyase n=1 Tax=Buchnera aphidicola TaxID=9 RepID=UPI003463F0D1
MNVFSITAISPIDGRYFEMTSILKKLFSEYGLLKFRIKIEILWLKQLSMHAELKELPSFNQSIIKILTEIEENFNEEDALYIKILEKKNQHDVKSIEYFLKNKIQMQLNCSINLEFIHFSCTSDDINNLAYALILKDTRKNILIPLWDNIIQEIKKMVFKYKNIAILSRTHGQAATPSTMGKEIANFLYRMMRQLKIFKKIDILGKINGTVGNYNAHHVAYPNINWHKFSQEFVTGLGIKWNPFTTQIEPHDYISELLDCIIRFNNILLDFNRDIWSYISINYFNQNVNENEVGSSIMPHKINPIDFENSEGNLGLSNSIMQHMSNKLLISRWQRDLSDSTVLRNLGVAVSYSVIAYKSVLSGISKLQINKKVLFTDLEMHWEILAEPIQTMMRKNNIKNSYEILKKMTRGKKINQKLIRDFINTLNIPDQEKRQLQLLTPHNYLGYASRIVDEII